MKRNTTIIMTIQGNSFGYFNVISYESIFQKLRVNVYLDNILQVFRSKKMYKKTDVVGQKKLMNVFVKYNFPTLIFFSRFFRHFLKGRIRIFFMCLLTHSERVHTTILFGIRFVIYHNR